MFKCVFFVSWFMEQAVVERVSLCHGTVSMARGSISVTIDSVDSITGRVTVVQCVVWSQC